ncbi:MAG: sugar phosphate nucleotidyltransferase [Dehalococcoidia bacterium]
MDAIVLVGGQGTRLRPLTHTRHKSLVPVCNRPAIEYLFSWLEANGFQRSVLAIGRYNEDLADAYRAGRPGGLEVVLVEETERLESGGGIRNAVEESGIDDRFVVLNGDVFVDFDFAPALRQHIAQEADLTLALHPEDDPSQYGVAVVDELGRVTGFVEKPPLGTAPSNLVNAGVWIFERALVDQIPPGAVRVEETLFPSLVARRRTVLGYQFPGLWADIGTPARYLALNRAILERDSVTVDGPGAIIDPAAQVRASSLGPGSTVAAGARVDGSILWEGVTVAAGAEVEGSILADGVRIGERARVLGAVIGSGAVIAAGVTVPPGTLIEPGTRYDGKS